MVVKNYISSGRWIAFVFLLLLPGSSAQYDVRFISQTFTPEHNMNGFYHALINAPQLEGAIQEVTAVEITEAEDAIVPDGIYIAFQRSALNVPDTPTLENMVDEIIQAQAGTGEVFRGGDAVADEDDVLVEIFVNFSPIYRTTATSPNPDPRPPPDDHPRPPLNPMGPPEPPAGWSCATEAAVFENQYENDFRVVNFMDPQNIYQFSFVFSSSL